jgi:hypothetical protein
MLRLNPRFLSVRWDVPKNPDDSKTGLSAEYLYMYLSFVVPSSYIERED